MVEIGNAQLYRMTEKECQNEDHLTYTAYGIAYCGDGCVRTGIDDVSSEAPLVSKMVEMFNACELAPDRLVSTVAALLP